MKIDTSDEIIAFLRDPVFRASALKTDTVTGFLRNCDSASDYDAFNAMCENLFLFAGHPLRARFLSLIAPFVFEGEEQISLYLPENRRLVWKRIFCDEAESASLQCDFVIKKKPLLLNNEEKKIFNIESAIDISADDIFSLLERIIAKIKDQGAEFLSIDLTKISYARPDDFHATKAYDALKNRAGGEDIIKLWLLCRVLMNLNLKLILKTDSLKKVEELSALIFRLRLCPKIIVCADIFGNLELDELHSFILLNKEKSISVSLYASREMQFNSTASVAEKLSDIFSFLPLICLESVDISADIVSLALKKSLTEYEMGLALNYLYRAK